MKSSKSLLFAGSLCLFTFVFLAAKCNESAAPQTSPKITFDLDQIDENGLSTRPGSEVAIDYEYCIPADEKLASEVKKIDPGLKIMHNSKGRIGCSATEWLCLGNTHQKDWRKILLKLAALDYVKQIDQTFFE